VRKPLTELLICRDRFGWNSGRNNIPWGALSSDADKYRAACHVESRNDPTLWHGVNDGCQKYMKCCPVPSALAVGLNIGMGTQPTASVPVFIHFGDSELRR
jgi:hypothetical protein